MLSKVASQPQHHVACMHPRHVSKHSVQPLVPLSPGSKCRGCRQHPTTGARNHSSSQDRKRGVKVHAKPDRGSLAALEAAIGAINGILGAHTKRSTQQKQKQQGSGPGQQGSTAAGGAKPAPGPSKLITFSAKASGSVPVKEWYKIQDDATNSDSSASSSSSNGTQHGASSSSRAAHFVPTKPPPVSDWARSLQSYLSLPLEQYSVLDPSLVTRLPPGTDTEVLLTKLLAARKERRTAKQQQSQQDASAGSSSSSGTSLQPKMKQLQEQVGLDSDAPSSSTEHSSSDGGSNGSSSSSSSQTSAQASAPVDTAGTSSNGTSSSSNGASKGDPSSSSSKHSQAQAEVAAAAAELSGSATPAAAAAASTTAAGAAAAEAGEAGGCFLLRIPMEELVGVALEPLLIITVNIDPVHGQVNFRASRLVVGDERFDSEFKVDLQAVMNSKITKQPHVVHARLEHDPAASSSTSSSNSSGVSKVGVPSSSTSGSSEGGLATSAAAVSVAEAPASAQDPQQQQQQDKKALYWQRTSALSCKVNLGMTLRLPYPLSIVPGPLLSTTAGLVAKLVMQSLLPSFLELLATDYGRWSTGVSRAAPVGSLIAAGKQHLKQQ